jgi:hypothetical protein
VAGYPLQELREVGYSAQEIVSALAELRQGGTTCADARAHEGYSLQEIKAAGYVEGLKAAGFRCQEAKGVGETKSSRVFSHGSNTRLIYSVFVNTAWIWFPPPESWSHKVRS